VRIGVFGGAESSHLFGYRKNDEKRARDDQPAEVDRPDLEAGGNREEDVEIAHGKHPDDENSVSG